VILLEFMRASVGVAANKSKAEKSRLSGGFDVY